MSIILSWNKKILLGAFIFFTLSISAFGEEYCIDQSRYMRWLCNNVPGAREACYAPPKIGKFLSREGCEKARLRALPNDFRWQQMTECVPCGPSIKSPSTPPHELKGEDKAQEEIEKVKRDIIEAEASRNRYLKILEEEKQEKSHEFKGGLEELSGKIKISSPPMTSLERERYKKALEEAYCMAFISVQAAREALNGKVDVSKNLISDLERTRASAEKGIDDRISGLCPKEIKLKIPEVNVSIEKDSQYRLFREITTTVTTSLIPRIEMNYEKIRELGEKKKGVEKRMLRIKEEVKKARNEIERKELLAEEEDLEKKMSELLEEVKTQEKQAEELRKEIESMESKLTPFLPSQSSRP